MVNPYDPPRPVLDEIDADLSVEVSFSLNRKQLRFAIEQTMLRFHAIRLILGSLAMILISTTALILSTSYGAIVLCATLLLSLLTSAAVYTALVHASQIAVRQGWQELGIEEGQRCRLSISRSTLSVRTDTRTRTWHGDALNLYRTSRGILLCPEPLVPVFVPRDADYEQGDQESLCDLVSNTKRQNRKTVSAVHDA